MTRTVFGKVLIVLATRDFHALDMGHVIRMPLANAMIGQTRPINILPVLLVKNVKNTGTAENVIYGATPIVPMCLMNLPSVPTHAMVQISDATALVHAISFPQHWANEFNVHVGALTPHGFARAAKLIITR